MEIASLLGVSAVEKINDGLPSKFDDLGELGESEGRPASDNELRELYMKSKILTRDSQ